MRLRGSDSWRFGHGDAGYLTTALQIRDAAALAVPAAPDIPPALRIRAPFRHELSPAGHVAASYHWVAWWRMLTSQACGRPAASGTPSRTART